MIFFPETFHTYKNLQIIECGGLEKTPDIVFGIRPDRISSQISGKNQNPNRLTDKLMLMPKNDTFKQVSSYTVPTLFCYSYLPYSAGGETLAPSDDYRSRELESGEQEEGCLLDCTKVQQQQQQVKKSRPDFYSSFVHVNQNQAKNKRKNKINNLNLNSFSLTVQKNKIHWNAPSK